jgi:hypothetical protein
MIEVNLRKPVAGSGAGAIGFGHDFSFGKAIG